MDLYQLNEQHHRDRAKYWIEQGRPDYAQGSIRKAAKWQQKRREFDYAINGAYPKTVIEGMMDEWMQDHARKVAKQYEDTIWIGTYATTPETER